jgi:hypothetical protein
MDVIVSRKDGLDDLTIPNDPEFVVNEVEASSGCPVES